MSIALLGTAVLIGWYWSIPVLKTILPGLASMKPNTALGLAMAGVALMMATGESSLRRRRIEQLLAVATMAIGSLTTLEYAGSLDLGIDQLLFAADRGDSPLSNPGRMAPVTAVCLTLGGLALLSLKVRPVLAQLAAIPVLALAFVSVTGYILGVQSFYTAVGFSSVALHTAIALMFLAIGILAARPTEGLMKLVAGPTLGGMMFRRLLLIPVLLVALGWLSLQGSRLGLYDAHFRLALMVVVGGAGALVATGVVARVLDAIDDERRHLAANLQILTERKRADEKFRDLLESAPDAMVIVNGNGQIVLVNSLAEKVFGHARSDLMGQSVEMLIPERYRATHSVYRHGYIDSPRTRPMGAATELYGLRKDGREFPIEVSLSPVQTEEGLLVSSVIRDITERKQSEAARAHLAAIVAQSDDAIISKSVDGTVLSWNSGAEKLFGYSAEEMIGRPITVLFPADRRDEENMLLEELRAGRMVSHFETKRVRKDGTVVDVSVGLSPIRDARGRLIGVSKIARDITERLRMEAQQALTRTLQESENRLKQFISRAPAALAMFDREMRYVAASRKWCEDYLDGNSDIIGRPHYDLFPGISHAWKDVHRRALAGETVHADEDLYVTANGSERWLKWEVAPWLTMAGRIGGIVIVAEDITTPKLAQRRLAEQHALLRVTLDSIGDAVITTDQRGNVEWLNPVASRLTGWSLSEARGRPIGEVARIVDEETRQPLLGPAVAALEEGRVVALPEQTVLIARHGTEHGIQDSAAPIRDDDGAILGTVLVFHDVSEQRRLVREVSHRASHDALTGLINRFEFDVRLRHAVTSARQEGRIHALMYMDLDQFKLINDACGHAAGDRLLRQVAALFQGVIRAHDTLARLGGDEFALLLEDCTTHQAHRVAEQLCDRLESFRFAHDDQRFRIGASIGLVPIDARWSSDADVMQAADTACYAAKEAGRNRVHEWFDTDKAVQARHREMQWVTRLETAFDERLFRLYAQRIERCRTDGSRTPSLHCEVLLRLTEVNGSLVSPAIFLPAAERFDMATRIDRWVVREVIHRMMSLDADRLGIVAINLSAHSIGDRAFHHYAIEEVSRLPAPGTLCFEITETAAITHLEEARTFMAEMRSRGVHIALDDFGVGAASFGYLKILPVDFLKIAGEFVQDMLRDRLDYTAVRCFRDIAAVCDLQTVAECVETEDVLAELQRIGIDLVQGYLIHRPEPLELLVSGMLESRIETNFDR